MARKKTVKRKGKKSVTSKNNFKNVFGSGNIKRNITLIVNNLLLFVALCFVSLVLYRFLNNTFLRNLFQVMAMVFGFVSVAFLICLLVLVIMKFVSKKK